MARCRSCNAPVLWAVTTNGKRMPVDAEDQGGYLVPLLVNDGNVVLDSGSWPDRATVRYVDPGPGRLRSHFATCPEGDEWRKKKAAK